MLDNNDFNPFSSIWGKYMCSEVLQSILKTEHREAGFRLEEDDHFIFLYDREGKRLCIFSADGATATSIQKEADALLGKATCP